MPKETDPLDARLSPPTKSQSKGCLNLKTVLTSWSIWISTVFTVLTLVSSIAFMIFFSKGLAGFAKQINAFVKVGDLGNAFFEMLIIILVVVFVCYLFIVHLASVKFFRNCLNNCGTVCILFLSSALSQIFLLGWVVITSIVAALTLVYFIFIGAIFAFCKLVDSECFNFKVLLPAIAKMFESKDVDLTFCKEKQELLCNKQNNMIDNFLYAFVLALLTFLGCMVVQNCVVYGLGKNNAKSKQSSRSETVEMSELK